MTERMTVAVDGYRVGERILEDAYFDVEVEAESWTKVTVLSVKIQDKYADYFKKLNEEYWYDRVKEEVEDDPYTHLFEDDEQCPQEKFDELVAKWGDPDFSSVTVGVGDLIE